MDVRGRRRTSVVDQAYKSAVNLFDVRRTHRETRSARPQVLYELQHGQTVKQQTLSELDRKKVEEQQTVAVSTPYRSRVGIRLLTVCQHLSRLLNSNIS